MLVKEGAHDVLGGLDCWLGALQGWASMCLVWMSPVSCQKNTKEELSMIIRSSRGTALLRELADAPVSVLTEKIISSRLDVNAHSILTVVGR